MKKPTPIQITIPDPCTQDWSAMQPVQGGRHCAHCQKAVVDFTRMTDAQLLSFLQKSGEVPCGRFTSEQLDRTIKAVEVPKSTRWARIAAGLLLSLGLTKEARAQSGGKKQVARQHHAENQRQAKITEAAYCTEIMGILKDNKGNPIVDALVRVLKDGIEKGQTLTDFDGNYSIKSLDSGVYKVKFEYLGKDTVRDAVIVMAGEVKRVNAVIGKSSYLDEIHIRQGVMVTPLINPEVPIMVPEEPKKRRKGLFR